jgi:hypothetical protein
MLIAIIAKLSLRTYKDVEENRHSFSVSELDEYAL